MNRRWKREAHLIRGWWECSGWTRLNGAAEVQWSNAEVEWSNAAEVQWSNAEVEQDWMEQQQRHKVDECSSATRLNGEQQRHKIERSKVDESSSGTRLNGPAAQREWTWVKKQREWRSSVSEDTARREWRSSERDWRRTRTEPQTLMARSFCSALAPEHIHMYIHVHVIYMYMHIHVYACTCICMYMYMHVHVYANICTCIYMYMYIYAYTYTCVYTCVCTYVYTRVYTCFQRFVRKCLMKNKNGVHVQSKVVNVNVKITSIRLDSSDLLLIFLN